MRKPIGLAALLVAATLLVYAQVAGFDFVTLDDPVYASDNLHVQTGLTRQNVIWSFSGFHDANWIPFTWLSLMLDTDLYGFRPGGYHATNVLLHVANTLLLFACLARATGKQARSAVVAALFALHPLHVESVAWIAERKDVLSTWFGLLSVLAYVNYATRGGGWKLAASFFCFVFSLLSKQTLVTLPFVFLLLDFWPLGRWKWNRSSRVAEPDLAEGSTDRHPPTRLVRLIVEKVPFLAISAVFSMIAMRAQRSGHAVLSLETVPLMARFENAVFVYAAYLWKALIPLDLAVYYPLPNGPLAWSTVIGAGALLVAISAAALTQLRRYPFLFVGWAWYLGTLIPMIGIVQIGTQQMADRYTYFPLIGPFFAIVWLISELVPAVARRAQVLTAAAVTTLTALAALTFLQVGYWQDTIVLFRHTVASAGQSPFAASALAYALLVRGETSEGYALLWSVTRMKPKDPQTLYNVGFGMQSVGQLDEAAEYYRAALAIDDRDADAHTNLGVIYCQRRQYRQGKEQYLRAIEVNPEQVKAYVNLGILCVETGEYAEAIAYSQHALALDPHLVDCHLNIGVALRAQGRLDEAIEQFQYVLARSPNDVDARRELARTLAMKRGSGIPTGGVKQ